MDEEANLLPNHEVTTIKLAKAMEESCRKLRERFNAKFCHDVIENHGHAFLQAREWKTAGEAGQTLLTPKEAITQWQKSFGRKN